VIEKVKTMEKKLSDVKQRNEEELSLV